MKQQSTRQKKTAMMSVVLLVSIALLAAAQGMNIVLDIDGTTIFSTTGPPQGIVRTDNFAEAINTYLEKCTPDTEGMCKVPIRVSTKWPLKLENLEVYYTLTENRTFQNNTIENNPPTAAFVTNPQEGVAPLHVVFEAQGSSDSDGTITDYEWKIGQETHKGFNATHTFSTAGTHEIVLTVTDDKGAMAQARKNIVVREASNEIPTATFTADPLEGEAPLSVTLDASASKDLDGNIIEYLWDLGNGEQSSGSLTRHTYTTPGIKTVHLKVKDDKGTFAETSKTIVVKTKPNLPPHAQFNASPETGKAPLHVLFDASASRDPDGTITEINWNFGDGTQATGERVEHNFDLEGSYTVVLNVKDNQGVMETINKKIEVKPKNRPPQITGPDFIRFTRSQPYHQFGIDATDPDGDPLQYKILWSPHERNWIHSGTGLAANQYDATPRFFSRNFLQTLPSRSCGRRDPPLWFYVTDGQEEVSKAAWWMMC